MCIIHPPGGSLFKILVVDNYDSFVYTLIDYLRQLGSEAVVVKQDESRRSINAMLAGCGAVLVSPGPGRPEDAGITIPVIRSAQSAGVPLLGVCLGHQALAVAFGGKVDRSSRIMHGKPVVITRFDAEDVTCSTGQPYLHNAGRLTLDTSCHPGSATKARAARNVQSVKFGQLAPQKAEPNTPTADAIHHRQAEAGETEGSTCCTRDSPKANCASTNPAHSPVLTKTQDNLNPFTQPTDASLATTNMPSRKTSFTGTTQDQSPNATGVKSANLSTGATSYTHHNVDTFHVSPTPCKATQSTSHLSQASQHPPRSSSIFKGLPKTFTAIRYNSLTVTRVPQDLRITALDDRGEVMALEHRTAPLYGVQFHPESAASEWGFQILENWLHVAGFHKTAKTPHRPRK